MSLTLIVLVSACSGEKVDDELADKYTAKAEEVIALLNEQQYEGLRAMFDAEMKAGLTEDKLTELQPFIDESGTFETIDKSTVEKSDNFHVVVLTAVYSEDTRVFTISFNENDEVSGLFVK